MQTLWNRLLFLSFLIIIPSISQALVTELGLSYSYRKSSFDESNNSEQQAVAGTVSFYLWERVALEFGYMNGLYVQKEQQPDNIGYQIRTTTLYSDTYSAELILVFADRKAKFQPFIKGGMSYLKRRRVVQDEGSPSWEIKYDGVSPSYGAGIKFFFSENLSIRAGYDFLQTPADSETKVDEASGRLGISWMF